jgi:protein TonB
MIAKSESGFSFLLAGISLFLITKCDGQNTQNQAPFACIYSENIPEFPGGNDSLMSFTKMHVHYPPGDYDIDISGKVVVGFDVDADGSVINIQVVRRLYPSFDAEAVRVVKLFPKFKPGSELGKPAKIHMLLPVLFKPE